MTDKLALAGRLVMGVIFVVFGLNGFLQFLPMPPLPEKAMAMMGGLGASGYFFPFLKITEIVTGALLLVNKFVPLALTILAPVVLNIFLFHAFLDPSGLAMPIFLVIDLLFLAYVHRDAYSKILKA